MLPNNPFQVPELLDRIIDFLHNDHGSLLAAALVCRMMVPSCQYHLLTDITLEKKTGAVRLTEHLVAHPEQAGLVHSLSVSGATGASPSDKEAWALVSTTPILKRLKFSRMFMSPNISENQTFKSVRHLHFDGCIFNSAPRFVLALVAFPQLDTLWIAATSSMTAANSDFALIDAIPVSAHISVRELRVTRSYYSLVVAKVIQVADLTSFSTAARSIDDLRYLLLFTKTAGSHLHKLDITISLPEVEIAAPLASFVAEIELPQLRTLNITWQKLDNPSNADLIRSLVDLPEIFVAPKLERIHIALVRWPDDSVVDHDWESLKQLDWAAVANAFRGMQALRSVAQPPVRVELGHNLAGAPADAPFTSGLRRLHEAGLIDLVLG